MTFDDLVFEPHQLGSGEHAKAMFANGYGASVVTGPMFYSSPGSPYELAILGPNGIEYDTPVHDKHDNHDVFGHLSAEEVTELLAEIESI